jgi:adenylate cyclase
MADESVRRRLAAILSADVVGYSRLMGADEAGTLAALQAHRRELIDPEIEKHDGRLVKLMGDGALVEFASIVQATECAVAIQRVMALRNADMPADRRIDLRIGLNLGDIIIDGDDIYGDGVNIAARLEAMAEPGGTCISRTVVTQTRGKLEFPTADLGEQELRNIAQPVHVFRVLAEPRAGGRSAADAARQAVDRGAPAPEHVGRPGAGIFC